MRWATALVATLIAVASIAVVVWIVLARMNVETEAQLTRQLESVATLKDNQIARWLDTGQLALDLILSESFRYNRFVFFLTSEDPTEQRRNVAAMKQLAESQEIFDEVFLYTNAGQVLASSEVERLDAVIRQEPYFTPSLAQASYIQTPYFDSTLGEFTTIITRLLRDRDDVPMGVLAARLNMDMLGDIMLERAGLGRTGETYLVSAENRFLVTPSRFEGYPRHRAYHSEGINRALRGESGAGTYENYREPPVRVVGVYRWLPELRVALLAEVEEAEALAPAQQAFGFAIAVAAAVAALAGVIGFVASSVVIRPLGELARLAARVAGGDLNLRARVAWRNEVGQVAAAFNTMADQLTHLISTLEQRVEARTRDLTAIGDVGRIATQIHDLDRLLPRIVNLIRSRFGFYHVQIFLIDETGQHAVLKASTGAAGAELLRQHHSLAVGSDSVIGQVTQTGEPVIALDTRDAAVVHRPNPLLPHTRSEMALPLRVGDRVIGALDVQSVESAAFEAYHVELFRGMADQVAIAINNATLLNESRARLEEIEALNRQLVGETWQRHVRAHRGQVLAFSADPTGVQPVESTSPEIARALAGGEPVVRHDGEMVHVALPIRYRGGVVGALEFAIPRSDSSDERLSLAQALADRLGVSAESARLFEQAQRLAARERQVNQITVQLQAQSELDRMVTVAAHEIRQALQARRAAVRIEVE